MRTVQEAVDLGVGRMSLGGIVEPRDDVMTARGLVKKILTFRCDSGIPLYLIDVCSKGGWDTRGRGWADLTTGEDACDPDGLVGGIRGSSGAFS